MSSGPYHMAFIDDEAYIDDELRYQPYYMQPYKSTLMMNAATVSMTDYYNFFMTHTPWTP